jgi:hypothetical protein
LNGGRWAPVVSVGKYSRASREPRRRLQCSVGVAHTEQWVGSHTELSRMVALFDANQRFCRHSFHGRCVRIHVVDSLCSQLWLSSGTGVEQWAVCAHPASNEPEALPSSDWIPDAQYERTEVERFACKASIAAKTRWQQTSRCKHRAAPSTGDTSGTALCKGDEYGCAASSCQSWDDRSRW